MAELTRDKLAVIKEYVKETAEDLNEAFETKRHEKELKDKLDLIISKNKDLATSTEKVIRINQDELLWIDKTKKATTTLDESKLTPEELEKYNQLKIDINKKIEKQKEIEKKMEVVDEVISSIRYVILKNQPEIKASDLSETLNSLVSMYDEANDIMGEIFVGIKSFVFKMKNWFMGIFNTKK